MTFSIVAADTQTGDWGIAVASKFPCVGAVVPWARAGVGAVATQSWANTSFGPDGLELMGDGIDAERSYRATELAYRQSLASYMVALEQLRQAVGTRSLP